MSKKRKRQANAFVNPACRKYTVRIGAERFLGAAVVIFAVGCTVPFCLAILHEEKPFVPENIGILALALLLCLFPAVPTLYCFRFRIEFKDTERELRYRYFFRFRTVKLSAITEVYRKYDGKVTYLHICAPHLHLRVNTVCCSNVRELTQFLMTHIPKRVTLRTRNYPHSSR